MRQVRERVFRVEPVGHRWELRRDGSLLYSHGDRQRVVDNGEATAMGNRPSRFIVHQRDGSIESETRYDLDLAVYSDDHRSGDPLYLDIKDARPCP